MQRILIAVSLAALSCSALAESASMMVYRVWEKGLEPYISRILVTDDFVRLDEGSDAGGYTLFDRQQEILYNVSPEERTILVMNPTTPAPEESGSLILQEQVRVDSKAPAVAGQQPKEVTLLANGESCSDLVVIDGVMDDAVAAFAELKLVLARIQAATLDTVPLNMRTPCDLAANVYAADRSLRFGLPLHERSDGRSQSLVDFVAGHEVDAVLFELPADFSRRSMFGAGAI